LNGWYGRIYVSRRGKGAGKSAGYDFTAASAGLLEQVVKWTIEVNKRVRQKWREEGLDNRLQVARIDGVRSS